LKEKFAGMEIVRFGPRGGRGNKANEGMPFTGHLPTNFISRWGGDREKNFEAREGSLHLVPRPSTINSFK